MKNLLFSFCVVLFSFASCHSTTNDNDALVKDSLYEKPVSTDKSTDSFIQKKITVDTEVDSIQPYTTLDSLQGVWISAEDKGDHVVIHGHHHDESNAGDTSKSELYLADTCLSSRSEANCKKQSGTYMMTYDADDTTEGYCYAIDEVNEKSLALIYTGRGNTLRFYKIKAAYDSEKKP